jgi:pimeloyl-ACP methyl ester carboxylesterase
VIAVLAAVIGLAACLALAIIEWTAWALVCPRRSLAPAPRLPAPWQIASITADDGVRLEADWLPQGPRVAILLHGFGEDRLGMRERGLWLGSLGYSVLSIDLRSRGGSGGERATFGPLEADDLRAWTDWLARNHSKATPVTVWGRSMGSSIGIRFAANEPDRVHQLVLEAPYASLETTVKRWLGRKHVPAVLARLALRRAGRLAGSRLDHPSSCELAARVRATVLIVHGREDTLVPLDQAHGLARCFAEATVLEVPEARHTDVFDRSTPEVREAVAAFLGAVHPSPA